MLTIRSIFCRRQMLMVLVMDFLLTGPLDADDTIQGITAQIVEARTFTAQYVTLANQSFKPASPEYVQSYKLYAAALSKYTAWNSYVTSAVRAGKAKSLQQNTSYEKIASDASVTAKSFTDFVDLKTTDQSKAVVAVLSSLADLGLKLWSNISDKIKKDRDAAATAFGNDTKWQTWNEIIGKVEPAKKDKPTNDVPEKADNSRDSESANSKPTKPKGQ